MLLRAVGFSLFELISADDIQDAGALQEFVGTLAQVLSGVLGFTISVVAIVVQLSADRFTPKVTELFLREKTNFFMILFLILANLVSVWTALIFSYIEKPLLLILLNLILGTLSFTLLIPYFIFVFNFLRPTSIIRKIDQQIRQAVFKVADQTHPSGQMLLAHRQCLSALDEIKGMAASAIQQRESPIMLDAINSLKFFVLDYATHKGRLPSAWFCLSEPIYQDPDFVSVDQVKLREIEAEKVWVELKIFRQYQAIFSDSLNDAREACYIIAINTREIAERSLKFDKLEITELSIKFFNTYLRALINARDIRTGYNIIKQYRLIAEAALENHHDEFALEIAHHFRYYSLIAYKAGLFFLSETFAFDLGLLAQICCWRSSNIHPILIEIFLKIDQDPESEQQEHTLQGIRKSQVKLAAYYLRSGLEGFARIIFEDMKDEPPARLQTICADLQSTSYDFWEFTDRGENFYYVEPELQPFIVQFFSWFTTFPGKAERQQP